MTEPQSDDEFETFLKRRTVLPNGMSDDDKLEPPKTLDALVLKRAREAVRERRQSNRAPRWAAPVALAATILLCLSVVLNVSLNTNRPAGDLRRQAADTAVRAPAAPASPAVEDERRETGASGAANEGGLREKVVTGTASREAILPEAKIAEPRAPRPPVLAETRTPAPGGFAYRSRTPPAAPSETPPLASAAPSPPATPATDGAAGLQEHEPALAKRQAGQAAGAAATAAAPHPRDPKTWLRQIDALRAEGKTAQADAEMQRFRAIFPAYPAKPGLPAPSEPPK